jgi:hypothetical protein
MTTTAYKVHCLPLTKTKENWLKERVDEYARIYNLAAKLTPSLPERYIQSQNPSELYSCWIKHNGTETPLLHSIILSGLQKFNALKDACSNYKTRKTLNQKTSRVSFIETPNIIKFENSEYKIIRINKTRMRFM